MNQQAMPSVPSLTHFAGLRLEHVDAVHLYAQLAVRSRQEVDVRLAEDDEQIALAGGFEIFGHVQVGVHARLEYRNAAELLNSVVWAS